MSKISIFLFLLSYFVYSLFLLQNFVPHQPNNVTRRAVGPVDEGRGNPGFCNFSPRAGKRGASRPSEQPRQIENHRAGKISAMPEFCQRFSMLSLRQTAFTDACLSQMPTVKAECCQYSERGGAVRENLLLRDIWARPAVRCFSREVCPPHIPLIPDRKFHPMQVIFLSRLQTCVLCPLPRAEIGSYQNGSLTYSEQQKCTVVFVNISHWSIPPEASFFLLFNVWLFEASRTFRQFLRNFCNCWHLEKKKIAWTIYNA